MPLLTAWIEAARKNQPAARQALEQMGDLKGLEPLRNLHLGMIADYAGDTDAAQTAYDTLVTADAPPTFRVVQVVGNFLERHARSEAAKQLYARFAAEDDDTGIAAAGLERIAKGETPAPLITAPQQGAAQALFDLATLLNQRDTIDAALIYDRLALELAPGFPLAQLLAGEIRDQQNRTEDALALYPRHRPQFAGGALGAVARGAGTRHARQDRRGGDDAQGPCRRPSGRHRAARRELGDVLRLRNRFQEAAQAYDQAVQRSPKADAKSWRLYYDRGVGARALGGQWPTAKADLKTRAGKVPPWSESRWC